MTDSAHPRYGKVDTDYAMKLLTADADGPVWMVNLMHYREIADYPDGREVSISGREADDLYAPIDILNEIGADIVFLGDVDQQLLGDSPHWDRVAVVRYATGTSFIDMQSLPAFQEAHKHKDAGMEQTIVMGCRPLPYPEMPESAPRVEWADVPHPPTAEDGPVMVVHVLRFEDPDAARVTPDEMEAYQSAAATVASAHGVRVAGWFVVDGTIVGDGRAWHQVRFNLFPSKRAFMAVATDPARLQAQKDHRERAVADTYTMIVRPTIDVLADSITG